MDPNFAPPGTDTIARWAMTRRVQHRVRPDEAWFRKWEPFDTMVPFAYYFNSCSWPANPGSIALVEPWTEEDDFEPMDRTILGFVKHPGLRWQAAMRVGEHFITRVAFLENPPAPIVKIGDMLWDEHVVTRAASDNQACNAFTPSLRRLLQTWGFRGHLEMRPGGFVVHSAGYKPIPEHYQQLSDSISQIVTAALNPS